MLEFSLVFVYYVAAFTEGFLMADRLITLPAGRVMVITDLHGAWAVYERLRDQFLKFRAAGEVETLLFCGDLIHSEDPTNDASLDIVLDVMRLQHELGRPQVVMLLGNHELPHIYSFSLSRGSLLYTPPFEAALAALDVQPAARWRRADVMNFFMDAPLYAVTEAGVMFAHAGASPSLRLPDALRQVLEVDHRRLLREADEMIQRFGVEAARQNFERILKQPYDEQARALLAVSGRDDARYDDLLRGLVITNDNPLFDLLWSAVFTRNEQEVGLMEYKAAVADFLEGISTFCTHKQRVIVTGHIPVEGGYAEVGKQQLRLASFAHASPRREGCYLVMDTRQPVDSARALVPLLRPTADA